MEHTLLTSTHSTPAGIVKLTFRWSPMESLTVLVSLNGNDNVYITGMGIKGVNGLVDILTYLQRVMNVPREN